MAYEPSSVDWGSFFESSAGKGNKSYDNFLIHGHGPWAAALGALKILGRKAIPIGKKLLKESGKRAGQYLARVAKEEGIKTGQKILNDLSQPKHNKVTHVIRDRAREGVVQFASRVRKGQGGTRRGHGLGSTSTKGKKSPSLGIVKSERPKSGREYRPPLKKK